MNGIWHTMEVMPEVVDYISCSRISLLARLGFSDFGQPWHATGRVRSVHVVQLTFSGIGGLNDEHLNTLALALAYRESVGTLEMNDIIYLSSLLARHRRKSWLYKMCMFLEVED